MSYMSTLLDYAGVSWIQFLCHMFQNSKIIWLLMLVLQFLASFSYVMHVVHCRQKEEFLPCYSYISESLIGWVFNQLKSLTDRSRFFHKIGGGGGGVRESKSNEKFSGGGGASHNGKFSWRSAGQKRILQIWNLQRLASMGSDIQEDIYNLIQCWNN